MKEVARRRGESKKENDMFTKQQIKSGLSLAKEWFEGWKLEDLQPDQLIEAIEKASSGN